VGVDAFGEPLAVDFAKNSTMLVVGPAQSGRSTVVAGVLRGMDERVARRVLISPRRGSPLRDLDHWDHVITGDFSQALAELSDEVQARRTASDTAPMVVVIDDADDLLEGVEADHLGSIVRIAPDANTIVLAAASTFLVASSYSPWVRMMRNMGLGVVLQPTSREDTEVFNAPFPRRGLGTQPTGRGVLVDRQRLTAAQFVHV